MSNDFVSEAPYEYTAPTPDKKTTSYSSVKVIVFASDQDNHEKGWAGIAPDIVDKRVKIVLSDGVEPEQLHGNKSFMADIEVTSQYNKTKKSFEPKEILIGNTNL